MGMGFPETARSGLMTPVDDSGRPSGLPEEPHQWECAMSFASCVVVMLGGAVGSFLRYFLSFLALPISRDLPWGTILINIAGSFVIGLFGTLTLASGRHPAPENLRLFVMVGVCGGFTTFSSFSLQTLDLMRNGAMTSRRDQHRALGRPLRRGRGRRAPCRRPLQRRSPGGGSDRDRRGSLRAAGTSRFDGAARGRGAQVGAEGGLPLR